MAAMLTGVFPFVNSEATAAPPGCVLEPTGEIDADGRVVVRQATADDQLGVFLNGLTRVEPGGYGTMFAPFPGVVFGVHLSDSLAPRDQVGVEAGEWLLRKGRKGFRYVGGDATGHRFGNAVPEPVAVVPPPPPVPPALATRNLDGTESGTTTDLRADQGTGFEFVQSPGGAAYDVARLRAATDTQMGAVTVFSQVWDGAKIGRGTRAGQPGDDSRFPAGVTVCWGAANGRDAGASPSHWVGASDTSAGVVVHEAEGFTTADESIGLMLSRYGGTSGGFPFWRYSAVTVRFWPHPEYDDAVVPVVFAGDPVVPDGLSADDPVRNPCFGVTRPANSAGSGLVAINAGVYLGIDDGEVSACGVYQLVGGIITGRSTAPTTTPQATDYVTICRNGRPYRVTLSQISTLMQALAAPG